MYLHTKRMQIWHNITDCVALLKNVRYCLQTRRKNTLEQISLFLNISTSSYFILYSL